MAVLLGHGLATTNAPNKSGRAGRTAINFYELPGNLDGWTACVSAGWDDRPVIEVCDYDPRWIQRFGELRVEYEGAFRTTCVPFLSIEHVGSTSVPGLAAKPVIDIDIVVDAVDVNAASDVLRSLGFEPRGEMGIAQRWAFSAPKRLTGTHTYIVVAGSLALRNHLAVREALRADPDLRAEYAEIKRDVGASATDIDAYIAGKNAALQRILVAAGFSDQERAAIDDANQLPISERER